MSGMELTPVTFADACAFVALHHRHNKPPVGHKFSIGVESNGQLVGVAMVGRPNAGIPEDQPWPFRYLIEEGVYERTTAADRWRKQTRKVLAAAVKGNTR
jgi:hypothetical protein